MMMKYKSHKPTRTKNLGKEMMMMIKAGQALNLTIIVVETTGTKQCPANSMHKAQKKGKVLP